jgi:hypothetical protein
MATAPVTVKELTEAEIVAAEIAAITKRNEDAMKEIAAKTAKGAPPVPTKVDEKAANEAKKAMDEAITRVTALDASTIQGVIESRPKNIVKDINTILNLYAYSHPAIIQYKPDGTVVITLSPLVKAA